VFEQAIQEMKAGSTSLLDTCRVTMKNQMKYTMTLLAFCGFHQRKDMVDLLLNEGAGKCNMLIVVSQSSGM